MISNKMDYVVVTGGSGFIGSHLVEYLLSQGKTVVNIDKRDPSVKNEALFMKIDLSEPNWDFLGNPPSVLYHLAGEPWSMVKGQSWFEGSKYAFDNNTVGTYNTIRKIKPKTIVFSSTANVYGEGVGKKEDDPIHITSQYGYSKWIAEEIIRKCGTPYMIYRFGTVVGARGRTFPNRLVWSAVKGEKPELFNNGQSKRDIIDVRDIVRTLVEQSYHPISDTLNLASGNEISNYSMALITQRIAGQHGIDFKFELTDFAAPGYVKESTLYIKKVRDIYSWRPQYNHIQTFESLFDYYLHDPNPIEPPDWKSL